MPDNIIYWIPQTPDSTRHSTANVVPVVEETPVNQQAAIATAEAKEREDKAKKAEAEEKKKKEEKKKEEKAKEKAKEKEGKAQEKETQSEEESLSDGPRQEMIFLNQEPYQFVQKDIPQETFCIDSVFAQFNDIVPQSRESLFTEHKLQTSTLDNASEARHLNGTPDWIFGVLVVLLILLSVLINTLSIKTTEIIQALFNPRVLYRLLRDTNTRDLRPLLPMALINMATIALVPFAIKIPTLIQTPLDGLAYFGIALAGLIFYFFVRNGCVHLLGAIFENSPATSIYIANTYIFDYISGMIALPMLMLVSYCTLPKGLVYTFGGLLGLLMLMRLVRGIFLTISNVKNSKFYLFYYLCILEIVPLLIALKVLIS